MNFENITNVNAHNIFFVGRVEKSTSAKLYAVLQYAKMEIAYYKRLYEDMKEEWDVMKEKVNNTPVYPEPVVFNDVGEFLKKSRSNIDHTHAMAEWDKVNEMKNKAFHNLVKWENIKRETQLALMETIE